MAENKIGDMAGVRCSLFRDLLLKHMIRQI